jgi:hypothetical protein
MTTDENIIPVKRDLDTLLSLNTYQGMTDDEIESIIEYKIYVAKCDAQSKLMYNKITEETSARVAAYNETSRKTMELVQSILNRPLQLRTVSANE